MVSKWTKAKWIAIWSNISIIIISLSWQHLPSSSSFCGGQQQCMRCTTTRKRFSDGKNVRAGNKSGHKPTCLLTLKIFCWILAASLNAAAQIELEKLCMVNYGQAWTIVCYCFWNNYYFWSTFMMVSFLQRWDHPIDDLLPTAPHFASWRLHVEQLIVPFMAGLCQNAKAMYFETIGVSVSNLSVLFAQSRPV